MSLPLTVYGPVVTISRFILIDDIILLKIRNPKNPLIDTIFRCICLFGHLRTSELNINKLMSHKNKYARNFYSKLFTNRKVSDKTLKMFAIKSINSKYYHKNSKLFLVGRSAKYIIMIYENPSMNIKITPDSISEILNLASEYFYILIYRGKYNKAIKSLDKLIFEKNSGSFRKYFSCETILEILKFYSTILFYAFTRSLHIKKKICIYGKSLNHLKRFMSSFHTTINKHFVTFVKYSGSYCSEIDIQKSSITKIFTSFKHHVFTTIRSKTKTFIHINIVPEISRIFPWLKKNTKKPDIYFTL